MAEVSSGLGRHRWPKWRSPASGVGNFDGEILWERTGRRSRSIVLDLVGLGFNFQRKILRVLYEFSEHQRRLQFEGCVAEPLQTMTTILPGSKWSCLLLRTVLQDALSDVTKINPPLKLKVFVDDIAALLVVKNREVAEMAQMTMKKFKEEVGRKGLKLSVTENGKEGKSKMIASCRLLEDELLQCSREDGVTVANSMETLGVDLRTRVKGMGAKEKARRKK